MMSNDSWWGWEGFHPFKIATWIPVFGAWCGPGWSDGERSAALAPEAFGAGTPGASPVDLACMEHDLAYEAASGLPNQAALKLQADLKLRQDIRKLDWASLSPAETSYASMMDLAFAFKIMLVGIPGVALASARRQSSADAAPVLTHAQMQFMSADASGAVAGSSGSSGSHTDAFGVSVTYSIDAQGKLHIICSIPESSGQGGAGWQGDPFPLAEWLHTPSAEIQIGAGPALALAAGALHTEPMNAVQAPITQAPGFAADKSNGVLDDMAGWDKPREFPPVMSTAAMNQALRDYARDDAAPLWERMADSSAFDASSNLDIDADFGAAPYQDPRLAWARSSLYDALPAQGNLSAGMAWL